MTVHYSSQYNVVSPSILFPPSGIISSLGIADGAQKPINVMATKIASTLEFIVVRYSCDCIRDGRSQFWSQFIVNVHYNSKNILPNTWNCIHRFDFNHRLQWILYCETNIIFSNFWSIHHDKRFLIFLINELIKMNCAKWRVSLEWIGPTAQSMLETLKSCIFYFNHSWI